MPLKIDNRCQVCQFIQAQPTGQHLVKRLYQSTKFKQDGEPLSEIQREHDEFFSYNSLVNHLKKHQFISNKDLKKKTLDSINDQAASNAVKQMVSGDAVRALVMEKGLAGIEAGEIRLKGSDVIKAAKDQDDLVLKRKDQSIAIAEMIMKFQSGEMVYGGNDADNGPDGSGPNGRQFVASS